MNKHTPGPWIAEYRNAAYFDVYAAPGNEGRRGRVAEVTSHGGKDTPTMRANARLIAAAPELLEALQLAFRHLNGGSDSLTPAEHDRAFKLARAAIAKATGSEA